MELRENKLNLEEENSYYNPAFEEQDIKNQNELESCSLRNHNEHIKGEECVFVEQDLPKQKESIDESEQTHRKGCLEKKYDETCSFFRKHEAVIQYIFYGILSLGCLAGVIVASVMNFRRAFPLFVLTGAIIFFVIWDYLIAKYENKIAEFLSPGIRFLNKHWFWLKWLIWILLITGITCWLIFDTAKQGTLCLMSFAGLVFYILLMLIFSKYPTRVVWRPVLWGTGLQFLLGLLILRTTAGFEAFKWMGEQVRIFLEYSDVGSKFVFGEKYTDHFFAFKVLPIVIFFSTVISMLYYIGFMPWFISKIGWLMLVTLGTSPIESVVAAGNVFVGLTESPLLVRPYLQYLTMSEFHAIMTAGFSTIAGTVLGAYISFGVSAPHLLTASVMSAPASLAIAKLFWPETKVPKVTFKNASKMNKGDSRNILEAACQGASSSIPLVANIAATLIAFLSLLAFVNSALSWIGNLFDYPQLSFEVICSYFFMPFAFLMGIEWEDSFLVGKLIGYKTFFNEFIAFQYLAKIIELRKLGGPKFVDGVQQYISVRSETITTYAICGFANFGSLGIEIGSLTSIAPSRKKDIVGTAFRALIAGTVSSFMTACIAALLPKMPVIFCQEAYIP